MMKIYQATQARGRGVKIETDDLELYQEENRQDRMGNGMWVQHGWPSKWEVQEGNYSRKLCL